MTNIVITVTVPDASATEIIELITDRLGYDIDGTDTRDEFLQKEAAAQLKSIYRSAKAEQAMAAVRQAEDDADLVSFASEEE